MSQKDVNGRVIIYAKDNNSINKRENQMKMKSKFVPNFYNNTKSNKTKTIECMCAEKNKYNNSNYLVANICRGNHVKTLK